MCSRWFAYAPASRPIYDLLLKNGIIDCALHLDLKGRYAREKLIERIAVAYLRADEELWGDRFSVLFEPERMQDLQYATSFFWSVSGRGTLRRPAGTNSSLLGTLHRMGQDRF